MILSVADVTRLRHLSSTFADDGIEDERPHFHLPTPLSAISNIY